MANDDIKGMLVARRPELEQALYGFKHLTAERLIIIGVHAWERGSQTLKKCAPESIVRCIIQCGEMGLEPQTPLGHAYLVPYWSNTGKAYFCQLIIGYKGFEHLALLSGAVDDFRTDFVCEDEVKDFVYDPLDLKQPIRHRPRIFGGIREKIASVKPDKDGIVKGVVGAYAVAFQSNGIAKAYWASLEEILKARSRSEAVKSDKGPSGPWVDWPLAMFQKTPVRRLCSAGLRLTGEIAPRMAAALGADIETTEYSFTDLPEQPDDLPKVDEKGKKKGAATHTASPTAQGADGAGSSPSASAPQADKPKDPEPDPDPPSDEPIGVEAGDEYFQQALSFGLRPSAVQRVIETDFKISDLSQLKTSQVGRFLKACSEAAQK